MKNIDTIIYVLIVKFQQKCKPIEHNYQINVNHNQDQVYNVHWGKQHRARSADYIKQIDKFFIAIGLVAITVSQMALKFLPTIQSSWSFHHSSIGFS